MDGDYSRRLALWLAVLGTLAALPALYFVPANVLKYEVGLFPDWSIAPLSPALLVGGSTLALVLNLLAVMTVKAKRRPDGVAVTFTIRRRWSNLFVLGVGLLLLGAMALYIAVENFAL